MEDKEQKIIENTDALISMGLKEWLKTRRRKKSSKKKKGQEDQLREIEDKLVEDNVERA